MVHHKEPNVKTRMTQLISRGLTAGLTGLAGYAGAKFEAGELESAAGVIAPIVAALILAGIDLALHRIQLPSWARKWLDREEAAE